MNENIAVLLLSALLCLLVNGRNSNKSSAVTKMGDRLATIGMGQKWGGLQWVAGSPLGPHLTQCGLGRGLPLYQVAS